MPMWTRRMPLLRLGVASEDSRRVDVLEGWQPPWPILIPADGGLCRRVGTIQWLQRNRSDIYAGCKFVELVDPALQLCADLTGEVEVERPVWEADGERRCLPGVVVIRKATLMAATLCERSAFIWPDMASSEVVAGLADDGVVGVEP